MSYVERVWRTVEHPEITGVTVWRDTEGRDYLVPESDGEVIGVFAAKDIVEAAWPDIETVEDAARAMITEQMDGWDVEREREMPNAFDWRILHMYGTARENLPPDTDDAGSYDVEAVSAR